MRCWHKANRLLLGYMDNELSNSESDMVREHIARCKYCRVELEEYRKIDAWLISIGGYPSEERYKQIFDEACERVEKKKQQIKKSPLKSFLFKIRPAAVVSIMAIFLTGGFLCFKVASTRHSISLPAKVIHGTVRVTIPNAEIEAGNKTQLYLKPEGDGSTKVGVVYTYDPVSVLTKRSNINLTSGTTAYVYPDGKIGKPEKIPEAQLKKWQGELESRQKEEKEKS